MALGLVGQRVGLLQAGQRMRLDLFGQTRRLCRCLPVPFRLAGFRDQFLDGGDRGLHLVVAEGDRAEHFVFGQQVGFGFNHEHGLVGTGDDQVQARILKLAGVRVEHVVAVDEADPGAADRALEGAAGKCERGRGAEHGRDVAVDFRVQAHHGGDDLDLVHEAVGKQRTDRAIDQARGQRFLFGRPAFALEESAGNLAGGIEFFLIVDGQRKERLAGLGIGARDRSHQHHRVAHGHEHRTGGLTGQVAGFDLYFMLAVLERLAYFIEHLKTPVTKRKFGYDKTSVAAGNNRCFVRSLSRGTDDCRNN